jgi:hypothetical protein
MSITCQLCQKTFTKIIPWQHLKTHGITTQQYKQQFGSLYSADTLEKFQQRVPHNKGKKVTDPDRLFKHRLAIQQREQRFRCQEFSRGKAKTQQQKAILSQKTKQFAIDNPDKIIERAKKALETKKKNNYDFGKNRRGKQHSAVTKQLISEKSIVNNQKKSQHANDQILSRIDDLNLSLLNSIQETTLSLRCNSCDHDFSFTKQYFHLSKFKISMCPVCYPRSKPSSKQENELYEFVKGLCPDAVQSYRSHYHDKEIDIYVPSLNLGFEYNGLYWHSESVLLHNNRSPYSDYEKHLHFQNLNTRIVQIFEDEWTNKKEIVKSRITNILGRSTVKVPARKCTIKEISTRTASVFCNTNHIMGAGRSNIRLGLFFQTELIAVMTFSKNNLSRKVFSWELNRYAAKVNWLVVGGASKLFKAFVVDHCPTHVVSFSDNRWSDGNLYNQLGFEKINSGKPNYWYTVPNTARRIHRFALKKSAADPKSDTERELRRKQGYDRIWDCGSARWEWKPLQLFAA